MDGYTICEHLIWCQAKAANTCLVSNEIIRFSYSLFHCYYFIVVIILKGFPSTLNNFTGLDISTNWKCTWSLQSPLDCVCSNIVYLAI